MKLFLPYRIQPPTELQCTVSFWVIFLILIGLGTTCLFFGYRAPSEKATEAAHAICLGYGAIALAVAAYVIRRLWRRHGS